MLAIHRVFKKCEMKNSRKISSKVKNLVGVIGTGVLVILVLFLSLSSGCKPESPVVNDPPEFRDWRAISGFGTQAMVAGSSNKPAMEAGLQVILEGGNACDGALTAVLDQVTRAAGCWVSFAGHFTMVYYEAATGQVYTISAGYKTPLEETDPLTIPDQPIPSGRTALVPGFMAGVIAAHDRLGSVPRQRIFAPAIQTAEEGFTLTSDMAGLISYRAGVLYRLPETRAIFFKEGRNPYKAGDIFTQPALASTLRQVVQQGADYIYRGPWARKLIAAVQADGGRLTLRDLEEYQPLWTEPAHTVFSDTDAWAVNYPCSGGVSLISGLNMMEAAGQANISGYTMDPAAFSNLVKISRVGYCITFFPDFIEFLNRRYPGHNFSMKSLLEESTAHFFWELIASGEWDRLERDLFGGAGASLAYAGGHSDTVVAIDSMGNAASISHSIATVNWGTTGIFIDGISIPDSAVFRKYEMARVGTGQYLSDAMASLLVVRNGQPLLVCGSPGQSIRELTLQHVQNILYDNLEPARSIARRGFYGPDENMCQRVPLNDFSDSFIAGVEKLGLCLKQVSAREHYWTGILFIPNSGLFGGAPTDAPYNAGIAAY
jgi:gamma-glutamyltranspeptidase/glutathione hydrolase